MRGALLLALGALIPFVLAAAPAPAPYAIDVILPLTGSAAFAGQSQRDVARVYESIVNAAGGIHGRPVHFEIHDDQSNPTVDVQIANELIAKHPVLVLGPSIAASCAAVAPLFVNGPVDYCFSPGLVPPRGGYVFASSATLEAVVYAGYAHLRALGYRRLAVLIATDASGQQDMRFTTGSLALPENRSLQLVDMETFAPTDIGVAAQVAKIKAAKPDIVYVWAIGPAFGTALRELANAGLDVPVATSPSNGNPEELAQFKAFLPRTLLTTGLPYQAGVDNPALKAAAAQYLDGLRAAQIKPSPMQAYAWDPIKIAVTALQRLPAGADSTQLRGELESLHDVAGLFGSYDFRAGDQHGLDGRDSPFLAWDAAAGRWQPFDRPESKKEAQ